MEKILIIDTETTNTLDDALVYDIGYMVADFDGELYFGGFWSDEAPVVVFKQGVAVKFYRAPAWD